MTRADLKEAITAVFIRHRSLAFRFRQHDQHGKTPLPFVPHNPDTRHKENSLILAEPVQGTKLAKDGGC